MYFNSVLKVKFVELGESKKRKQICPVNEVFIDEKERDSLVNIQIICRNE